MVLVQFLIIDENAGSNNGAWHSININGRCNVRFVNYMLKHASQNDHILQLQSDVFKTPYSGNSIINCTNGVLIHTHPYTAFDQSHQAFHWENVVIPGRIQFSLVDLATGNLFAHAFNLILTFDIENLP